MSAFKNGFISYLLAKESSSLTIWKADKTIFKIVCKVLNVCLYDKHQYNTFKCSWNLSPAKSSLH
ncbi:hypothetical protein, partial [Vibrio campbellii]|uniref:hypothetical protein n=1 Tax=Vibrio campbellii TaxID=680 RepID=UPI001D196E5D